jgi:hypothetical protein
MNDEQRSVRMVKLVTRFDINSRMFVVVFVSVDHCLIDEFIRSFIHYDRCVRYFISLAGIN